MKITQHRRAFYPCCASDVSEPRRLLATYVDEVIFCDVRSHAAWTKQKESESHASAKFVIGDARDVIATLPPISVLFYRRDSEGEGGSGVYILGKRWLKEILKSFPASGGLIITDGSNSRSSLFRKMIRPGGYERKSWGWQFCPAAHQIFLIAHNLYIIEATQSVSTA